MVQLNFLNLRSKHSRKFDSTQQSVESKIQVTNIPIDVDITGLRVVISYSLYGNAGKYIGGLITNCKLINLHFPDVWIYVFVGNDFDHSILLQLNSFCNIKIVETGRSGHINMSYRFTTIDYDEVGITFSRDCDSYVNRRDRYCIQKFLESNKKFQIIRENLSHRIEILGGMWGVKKGMFDFKMCDKINEYFINIQNPGYGDDQQFLIKCIYPIVRDFSQVFDEFFHFPRETPEKIVGIPYELYNHVGAVALYNDMDPMEV